MGLNHFFHNVDLIFNFFEVVVLIIIISMSTIKFKSLFFGGVITLDNGHEYQVAEFE